VKNKNNLFSVLQIRSHAFSYAVAVTVMTNKRQARVTAVSKAFMGK